MLQLHFDGFVVITGTDTMCYCATALSFLLENLGKPVVFTGVRVAAAVVWKIELFCYCHLLLVCTHESCFVRYYNNTPKIEPNTSLRTIQ